MNTAPIVSRVWSFCTTLRDDGVGYGDYLEQLTYLIFLKMADEYAKPPYSRDVGIPEGYDWTSLTSRRGAELEAHYVMLLRKLGEQKGMLGQIFTMFVLTVAAAEAAVGLAILVVYFRNRGSIAVEDINVMKG